MAVPLPSPSCPVCAALLEFTRYGDHVEWHSATQTMDGWTVAGALYAIQQSIPVYPEHTPAADTLRLPPIGDTVRRRPPVPGVAELKGAELLRALADALDEDDDVNGDEL